VGASTGADSSTTASYSSCSKSWRVVGVSNLHVYAAMRGQSLADFQATRNAQIEYGVGARRGG